MGYTSLNPSLIIDRIELLLYIPDVDHYRYIYHTMWDLHLEGNARTWRGKYITSSNIKLPGQNSVYMEIGASRRRNYVKFSFKPDALTHDAWRAIYSLLVTLFEDGFVTLFNEARVNYIEIAADFRNIAVSELLTFDARIKNGSILPSYPAPIETLYIGHRRNSPKVFCVYNKALQLRDEKKIEVDGDLTRIEARIRRTRLAPRDLDQLANPFLSLNVCDKSQARSLLPSRRFARFMGQCDQHGANTALHNCSLARRKQYVGILKRRSCTWWQPQDIWEGWPQALQILAPRYDLPL